MFHKEPLTSMEPFHCGEGSLEFQKCSCLPL